MHHGQTHHPTKRAAEQKFPHRVDIPVPPGGLGNRLNQMLAWCVMNIRAEDWEQHGHMEKAPGQVSQDFARFYFATDAEADLFRWCWLSDRVAP